MAQSSDQVIFWKKLVSQKPLREILVIMADPRMPRWPKAESFTVAQHLTAKEQAVNAEAVELVKQLDGKIKRDFLSAGNGSGAEIEGYSKLSTMLEEAGGYSNLILADGLRRLVILRCSEWLISGSRSFSEIRKSIDTLSVPALDIRKFLERFSAEDEALSKHRADFAKITASQNIYGALEAAGIQGSTSLAPESFSQLIDSPSPLGLLTRVASTEFLYAISLKGLLLFLEKGGTFQELNPADITAFKNRMSGAERDFKYPPLGVRSLSASQLRSLFELSQDPGMKKEFLRIIFE